MEEKNLSNNNNENINNGNQQNNQNKSNTFNIIIGIATLLIALLGATFAYFSATARSRENDVSVRSAYVSIKYESGTEIRANNLIPASLDVAYKAFTKSQTEKLPEEEFVDEDEYINVNKDRRCVDSNGREVCYVYQFSVNSEGDTTGNTNINGYITVNTNEFQNLSYTIFEVEYEEDDDPATEEKEFKLDKFRNRLVKDNGYNYVSGLNFTEVDGNPGNENYSELKFAKFEPAEIEIETNEGVQTIHPVACLFGYSDNYSSLSPNDTNRCKTLSITNNKEHYYQIMIWLEETRNVQDEQDKPFEGTVNIEIPGSESRITGEMNP